MAYILELKNGTQKAEIMKAILEFKLPEDQIKLNRVNQSLEMTCALFNILQIRKNLERYYDANFEQDLPDAYDGINRMAKEITDILESYDINVYKLNE